MPSPITTTDHASPAFTGALDSLRAELERIPLGELDTVRLDIPSAVVAILGLAPNIQSLRPAMAERFGQAQASHVDRLSTTARAAGAAHAMHLVRLSATDLEPLSGEVVQMRRTLLIDATSLVNRRLLDASLLSELRGTASYQSQCFDVLQLVSAFRHDFAAVAPHTPVKPEELDRAEALANQFATAVGLRDKAVAGTSPSAELRRRAYTLLLRTYEEVRRMVAYLRWRTDDADSFAPSLFAGRSKKARDAEVESPFPDASGNGAGNGGAAIAPGMPGSNPFVSS